MTATEPTRAEPTSAPDKRELARIFRARLRSLLRDEGLEVPRFLADTGIDRSALSQFLDARRARLPRAETLRRIAVTCGVSVDWLLGLDNAPEGRQAIASSVQLEQERHADGSTPLDLWRREAAGTKIRYVPSSLPDMFALASPGTAADATSPASVSPPGRETENVLGGIDLAETDVEIAMPLQTLEMLADGTGLWSRTAAASRRAQLEHMHAVCAENYPALRLHLHDGTRTYSAPFTVFGKQRAAIYVGDAYLVTTAAEQVRAFVRRFDRLVRDTTVAAGDVGDALAGLALRAGGN